MNDADSGGQQGEGRGTMAAMSDPRARGNTLTGVMFALLAAAIGGAMPVYVGHMVQGIDPIALLVPVALVGVALFNALQLRDLPGYITMVRGNARDLLYLNVLTLIGWVTSFAALRFIEPVLSNSASVGLEPIATLALTVALRRQTSTILRSDVLASFAMLATAVAQIVVMWSGRSGLGATGHEMVGIGIACVLANGVANGALTVMPKSLFDSGMTRSQVLGCRLILLLIAGVLYLWIARPPLAPLLDNPFAVVAAFVGSIGTLYLIQAAIQFAEPVTVALICALNPIVSLGMQAFDPRLAFSLATLVTTLVMIGLVAWSTLEQVRASRGARAQT